ncbi:hypothetical protein P0Y35_07110 [Kiritimatiellaeota bacterium B1221]|nr:hypothetical protein [Kiritimatiellaeota bacterium B1221]
MKFPLLFIPFLLLTACSSPPPPAEAEYKIILSSHDPLTDAQLEMAEKIISDWHTLPSVRWYFYERLSTEEYARFKADIHQLAGSTPLPDGSVALVSIPPNPKNITDSHNQPHEIFYLLLLHHEPAPEQELAYINRMLDFMELPIPYNRKINGLRNIQRVMSESETHHDLNGPEMKEIRKRLYDLALSEKSPDNVRRGLATWLREMR